MTVWLKFFAGNKLSTSIRILIRFLNYMFYQKKEFECILIPLGAWTDLEPRLGQRFGGQLKPLGTRSNSSATVQGLKKRLCCELGSPSGKTLVMDADGQSQPWTTSGDHSDENKPLESFHGFTQPAQLDNLLLSTQGKTGIYIMQNTTVGII